MAAMGPPALPLPGFEVLEEIPTALNYGRPTSLEGEDPAFIHDFTLKLPPSVDETALLPHVPVIEAAIAAVLEGSAENDAFNELVLVTQTDPTAIVWLRAWFRYLRQGGSSYGMDTVVAETGRAPV